MFFATPALDEVYARWVALHAYAATIVAHEQADGKADDRVLRYELRKPADARLEVLEGSHRGGIVLWHGGRQVVAFRRGFGIVKMRYDVHDSRVSSPRGNGILTANLGSVLSCFRAHREDVREAPGPKVGGADTTEITLTYRDYVCPDDPAADREVTRDVLSVARSGGLPLKRERYAGNALVERWTLRDIVIDGK